MLPEPVQDRAVLYVSGAMTGEERDAFEVVLEFHTELRAQVAGLQETVAQVVMARVPSVAMPPLTLKERILGAVVTQPPKAEPVSLVVTNTRGLVEWINPAFTAMCGYSLEELKGRKPGQLLQGPDTDLAAVRRIRESLRAKRACREALVNYHKDGTPYRVDIRITPVLDDDGQPLWLVAKERKLPMDESNLSGAVS